MTSTLLLILPAALAALALAWMATRRRRIPDPQQTARAVELPAPQVLIAHIENGKIVEVWNTIAEGEGAWNDFWK